MFFSLNGYKLSRDIKAADIIVLISCAAMDLIIEKGANTISKILKNFPRKKVVLFGCMAPLAEFRNDSRLITIGPKELDRFSALFESKIPICECRTTQLRKDFCWHFLGRSEKDRFVHISQGCSNNCSYCNIKLMKGGVTSVPAARIRAEVNEIAAKKTDVITLMADDCGSYGHDINTNIAELFRELPAAGFAGTPLKYKIYYMFPALLIKYYRQLKPAFADRRIIDITVPLQSGAPRVLKLMNREYDLRKLSRIIREIRSLNPEIRIISHFIINFPGETMAEFEESLRYARLFKFSLFLPYSDNKRARAYRLAPKCTQDELEEKMRRVKEEIKKKTFKGLLTPRACMPEEFPDSQTYLAKDGAGA